jgi:hypothetical protein
MARPVCKMVNEGGCERSHKRIRHVGTVAAAKMESRTS